MLYMMHFAVVSPSNSACADVRCALRMCASVRCTSSAHTSQRRMNKAVGTGIVV